MTIADQIAADQADALRTIRRIAESLPGFTFAEDRSIIDGEAGPPCASTQEQPLTPNRPS